jgi:hypothetical protein
MTTGEPASVQAVTGPSTPKRMAAPYSDHRPSDRKEPVNGFRQSLSHRKEAGRCDWQ